MTAEHGSAIPEEAAFEGEPPITGESLCADVERFRRKNDPRLVSVMQRITAALLRRLPERYGVTENDSDTAQAGGQRKFSDEINEHVHTFRYVEIVAGEDESSRLFNRLLIVGPTWMGLGTSHEAVSISTYNESDGAIIGHTVFMADAEEIVRAADASSDTLSENLEHTSLAVLHFPATEWEGEKVDQENPHAYGYVNGRQSVAELPRLLQMNIALSGRTGFIYSGNLRNGQPFDVLSYAENIVAVLEQESTEYLGTNRMNFEYKKINRVL